MSYRLVTAPVTYPVTLVEANAHCRVDSGDEDTLMNGLIAAATDFVQLYLSRSIITQTWESVADDFSDEMLLGKGPVASVTSVKYYDTAGAEQTLSASYYEVDIVSDPQRIVLADGYSWPAVAAGINKVTVRFVTGYATTPTAVKQAILLLIGQWFDQRADATDRPIIAMPNAVEALLTNYRSFAI